MLDLLVAGGPVMIPILLLSVLALGLIIERVVAFARVRERRTDLLPWALGELAKGRGAVVAEELATSPSPEAAVLREGVLARATAPEERELRMRARAQEEYELEQQRQDQKQTDDRNSISFARRIMQPV